MYASLEDRAIDPLEPAACSPQEPEAPPDPASDGRGLSVIPTIVARQSVQERLARKWRKHFFRKLTKNALPLFLNGKDIISRDPMANGDYEMEIHSLMNFWAANGYGDFLLDIGANIGLSACQSGIGFQEIHLFEPNPDALHILKVNVRIALGSRKVHIHEYGLGAQSEVLKLFIPRGNWGGAFIRSVHNAYDDLLLSNKDGYSRFDPANYDAVEVQIEPAAVVLGSLLGALSERGLRRGVVKIDIEGFERLVTHALIQSTPPSTELFVIFENWRQASPSADLTSSAARPLSLFRLRSNLCARPKFFSRLRQAVRTWKDGEVWTLAPAEDRLHRGTYVMHIAPAA